MLSKEHFLPSSAFSPLYRLLTQLSLFLSGFLLCLCPILASAKDDFLVADVGFVDSEYSLQTRFESPLAEIVFEFSLCNAQSNSCIRLNSCSYSETEIREQMDEVSNPRVLSDLSWFFYRDDYSSVQLEEFFPAFRLLLNKIDQSRGSYDCDVDDLQILKDQITERQG